MDNSSGALWEHEDILPDMEIAYEALRASTENPSILATGGEAPLNLPSDVTIGAMQNFGHRNFAYVDQVLASDANVSNASAAVRPHSGTISGHGNALPPHSSARRNTIDGAEISVSRATTSGRTDGRSGSNRQ